MENTAICQILSTAESFIDKILLVISLDINTTYTGYIHLILLCFISHPELFKETYNNIVVMYHFFRENSHEHMETIINTIRNAVIEKRFSEDDRDWLLSNLNRLGIVSDENIKEICS